jgi:hypothetical protein
MLNLAVLLANVCAPGAERCDDSPHVSSPIPFLILAGVLLAAVMVGAILLWRARRL